MSSRIMIFAQKLEQFLVGSTAGESRAEVFWATFNDTPSEEKPEFITQEAKRFRHYLVNKRDQIKGDHDYQNWLKSKGRSHDVLSAEMKLHFADKTLREVNVFIQECVCLQIAEDGFEREQQDNIVYLFEHPLAIERRRKSG